MPAMIARLEVNAHRIAPEDWRIGQLGEIIIGQGLQDEDVLIVYWFDGDTPLRFDIIITQEVEPWKQLRWHSRRTVELGESEQKSLTGLVRPDLTRR